jgi:glycosyltransferase involved in cell wall biosynthesis
MKLGASDFISKPFDADDLEAPLANALRQYQLSREVESLRDQLQSQARHPLLFCHSQRMAEVAYAAAVQRCLDGEPFDLVVCDFLVPAVNLPRELPCPAVLFTHNVESEIWRRHTETQRSRLLRAFFDAQHRRMLRFEGQALSRFDRVLAVSDADRDTFARLYPDAARGPIDVVPTGVDTEFFAPRPRSAANRLVFTGSMDWIPNEDAMTFFCRDVLPLVRAEEPRVRLTIVGRAPSAAVRGLAADPRIEVTGRVDDVRPWVGDATVYIVPVRIGGGTRLKIFEAMAMNKAIVSTRVGAEGLPVVHGRHLLLADSPDEFAAAVIRLLRSRDLRSELGAAARALVVDHHDWGAVAQSLDGALCEAAASRRRPAAAAAIAAGEPRLGLHSHESRLPS